MRIFGLKESIDPSLQYFFHPHVAVLRRFAECAPPVLSLENPFKTNWREGVSCSPIRLFQHRV